MMIVIEGLDGAGKSTQVKRIREYLDSRLGSHKYIHFPRYDSPVYGDLISRFLRGEFGDINEVHPQLVALLYAEDRHNASDEIKGYLASGETVLLDRYVYSNCAYQCAKLPLEESRKELREWIYTTEYQKFDIPRPDINIFLDTPLSFVEKNLTSHREGADRDYLASESKDIHEASMAFQSAVRDQYLALCASDPSFIRIDCSDPSGNMLPSDDITEKIIAAIAPKL